MSMIAIIPARSGSKGLKDKNIMELAGKPLIAYSINAAKEAGIFDCIHVSTDSEKYAEIAKAYGAGVPFLRSEELSSDEANSWDVVIEVIDRYAALGKVFDSVMLLQPTSPLRTVNDIILAKKTYEKKHANAVISVCEAEHSPLLANTLDGTLSMDGFRRESLSVRRQELPTYYRINGAIYLVDIAFLRESQDVCRKGCYAYVMDKKRSVDIDDQYDFDFAEYLIDRGY